MTFRVICAPPTALAFVNPTRVVRARTAAEAVSALEEAHAATDAGQWIAGYLSYELGAAFVGEPVRDGEWPLLALGFFDAPTRLEPIETTQARSSPLLPTIGRDGYDRALAQIARAIYDGEVYQVNYTMPFWLHTPEDRLAWWWSIANETNAEYQAFIEDDDRAICSWSPELFLRFHGERVETRPMKGTAPLDDVHALEDPKNRAEHLMIVDLLRNDLRRICDDVVVDKLFGIERYPTFATMTTTVAGNLRPGSSLHEILRATFACGSVTGAPKRAAVTQIARLESRPRDVYCGSVGYLSPNWHGWWNVAIRTAQAASPGTLARFDVGGGIVADSRPADEWHELLVKSQFVRSHAAPCVVLETFASDADPATRRRHLARLARTAHAFAIDCDITTLTSTLESALARYQGRRIVRLRLGADGVELRDEPLHEQPQPVPVCLTDVRVRHDDPFLPWKTAWRPLHDAASEVARTRGCFDGILRNERNELTEGARTNVFIERDGILWTPPTRCGLLPGMLREALLGEGRARERVLRAEDLFTADAIFVGSSARGLLRAKMV